MANSTAPKSPRKKRAPVVSARTKTSASRPRFSPLHCAAPDIGLALLPPDRRLLPSAAEMSRLDQRAIAAGVSSLELMERAGEGISDFIAAVPSITTGQITIVCGPGNNGGDGLVVARLLSQSGLRVRVVLISAPRYSFEFLSQLTTLTAATPRKGTKSVQISRLCCTTLSEACDDSTPTLRSEDLPEALQHVPCIDELALEAQLSESNVVVDAMLGTGNKGAPRGSIGTAIECVNSSRKRNPLQMVLAVDTPSGVDASEGGVPGVAVHADRTIAIEFLKRGLLQYPAREYLGQVSVLPIGISEAVIHDPHTPTLLAPHSPLDVPFSILLPSSTRHLPAVRPRNAHKGLYLRVGVLGGSEAMPGAPTLAAHAALRAGAPLVAMSSRRSSVRAECPPEIMHMPMDGDPSGQWVAPTLAWLTRQPAVVALGPGLGTTKEAAEFFNTLLQSDRIREGPLVIDADGLSLLAKCSQSDSSLSLPQAVLTPHPGEMGRLLGIPAREVELNRYQSAQRIAEKFGTTVILKGASTIIASTGPGLALRGAVNIIGTPWLATGGSGDVLTGIVAALLAQGMAPFEAACGAVLLHARSGEIAAKRLSVESTAPILAGDIITALPEAISWLRTAEL